MPEGIIPYFQRRFPRANLDLKAKFRILSRNMDPNHENTEIKTLGGGGLMFISNVPLSKGDLIEAMVAYLNLEISFTAKVVWTEELFSPEDFEYKCGVEYVEIAENDRSLIYNIIAVKRGLESK